MWKRRIPGKERSDRGTQPEPLVKEGNTRGLGADIARFTGRKPSFPTQIVHPFLHPAPFPQEKRVSEAMCPRVDVEALDKRSSLLQLQELFQRTRYSRIPVFDGEIDKIIGVAMSKDLLEYVFSKEQSNVLDLPVETVSHGLIPPPSLPHPSPSLPSCPFSPPLSHLCSLVLFGCLYICLYIYIYIYIHIYSLLLLMHLPDRSFLVDLCIPPPISPLPCLPFFSDPHPHRTLHPEEAAPCPHADPLLSPPPSLFSCHPLDHATHLLRAGNDDDMDLLPGNAPTPGPHGHRRG